jgi:hypothetical protein
MFSDATRILIHAMETHGVRRLVCITGIGAGDSKGHGGFFYGKIIFPWFTKATYVDKDRQEALIRESSLARYRFGRVVLLSDRARAGNVWDPLPRGGPAMSFDSTSKDPEATMSARNPNGQPALRPLDPFHQPEACKSVMFTACGRSRQ